MAVDKAFILGITHSSSVPRVDFMLGDSGTIVENPVLDVDFSTVQDTSDLRSEVETVILAYCVNEGHSISASDIIWP